MHHFYGQCVTSVQNDPVGTFFEELDIYIRVEKRMSLREFMAQAGVAPGTLQSLRDGKTPDDLQPGTVRKIAAGMGKTVPEFNAWWREVSAKNAILSEKTLKELADWFDGGDYPSLEAWAEFDAARKDQAKRKLLALPGMKTAAQGEEFTQRRQAAKTSSTEQRKLEAKQKRRGN
jgi:transcriptional regulator with XRE-family HTH domain